MFRPERLQLRPSRTLRWLASLIHAVAALAPFLSSLPVAASIPLALLVAGHGLWFEYAWVRLRAGDSVLGLRWDEQRWWMTRRDGGEQEILPTAHSVLTTRLVLLRYQEIDGGSEGVVILFPDSGDADALRRLRVQLRFSFANLAASATRS